LQVKKMDIRALVLINSAAEIAANPAPVSPVSLTLLEVAGKSPLQRITERLRHYGIASVTAIADCDFTPPRRGANEDCTSYISCSHEQFWRIAENAVNEMIQDGAELVVLAALGPFAEVDFESLVQFHLDQQARVTRVCHQTRLLPVFCVSASRRNDAAALLRSRLTKFRSEYPFFRHAGYMNPLNSPRDLRQLAIDILTLKTETRPAGEELRPGVWMEPGAVVEKGARVLAPAFVGAFARIHTHAVVTRCSAVEHHARVDCGTVVENATVLPYTYVGAGLDLAHSVTGAGVVANLRRDVDVEVADPKLIGYVLEARVQRLIHATLGLAAYLPRQMWRAWFGEPEPQQPDLSTALHQTSPTLGNASGYQAPACDTNATGEFPSNLSVARPYGQR
jgi:hypothetical protein